MKTKFWIHNLGLGVWWNEQVGKLRFSLTNTKQCHWNNLFEFRISINQCILLQTINLTYLILPMCNGRKEFFNISGLNMLWQLLVKNSPSIRIRLPFRDGFVLADDHCTFLQSLDTLYMDLDCKKTSHF